MIADANVVNFPITSERKLVETPGRPTGLPYLPEIRRRKEKEMAADLIKHTPPSTFLISNLLHAMALNASKADIKNLRRVENLLCFEVARCGPVEGLEKARRCAASLVEGAERIARSRRKRRKK